MAWTGDLAELGRYARGYLRLMEHWHATLRPGEMLDVRYEDLIDDLEGEGRRIVAYCGLAWDERCLHFHETKRPVRTASLAQVRRPLYRSSIGAWRIFHRSCSRLSTRSALRQAQGDSGLRVTVSV